MNLTFLTTEEVAEILRISPGTLAKSWKDCIGYYRFPHRILFKRTDVDAFIKTRFVPPCQPELQAERKRLVTILEKRAFVLSQPSQKCCSCKREGRGQTC